jgi:hypothetical protein
MPEIVAQGGEWIRACVSASVTKHMIEASCKVDLQNKCG